MSFLITPADLLGAGLAVDVRLSAGRGWLPLIREALTDLEGLKILAIREEAGALVIDAIRGSAAQRERLAEIREASLHLCELCGQAGELVYEGLKDGRPAGWHRTRCPAHRDWHTSPPYTLEQCQAMRKALLEAKPARLRAASCKSPAMRLSTVRKFLQEGATPQPGSELSNQEAIRLAETEFPIKPWCLVRAWVIYDISAENFAGYVGSGLQPTMVYADCIVHDQQDRWDRGQWVRTSPLKSFTHGCLFETESTVYVLLGDGYRAGIVG